MPPEPYSRSPGPWKRFLLGTALVLLASASATSVAAFREVDRLVNALKSGSKLELGGELAQANPGKPQTIMLIGSDRRGETANDSIYGLANGARSDTVMLVRLDPGKNNISLMSLPRDLKVEIPGHGKDKLNAAYTIGGPKLTLRTVKQLTGLRINHVINVDFLGFIAAVDAIGCVYTDIDRRYYNDNSYSNYATIDLKQGYQRLCGRDALDYVRYRHEDNDLVRAARQQDFLRQAKEQVGVRGLIGDREQLIRIFGRYTSSNIRSRSQVLRLLKLAVASLGQPIREVHFEGKIGESYVTASSRSMRRLTQQFLGLDLDRRGRPRRAVARKEPRGLGLEDASGAGREQAVEAQELGARFPIYYPTTRTKGALFSGSPNVYRIKSPDGRVHRAYRMVIARGVVGEYYGLQGTTWKDPPILRAPSEKRRIGGREYELHFGGDRLRLVAWRTPQAVYWVPNTLTQSLSPRQMMAIARSARPL